MEVLLPVVIQAKGGAGFAENAFRVEFYRQLFPEGEGGALRFIQHRVGKVSDADIVLHSVTRRRSVKVILEQLEDERVTVALQVHRSQAIGKAFLPYWAVAL